MHACMHMYMYICTQHCKIVLFLDLYMAEKLLYLFLKTICPPSCFSRYITFSKEEEAIRCIQSVHGFVLEGNFLRYSHILSWSLTSSTQALHLSIIVFDDHYNYFFCRASFGTAKYCHAWLRNMVCKIH